MSITILSAIAAATLILGICCYIRIQNQIRRLHESIGRLREEVRFLRQQDGRLASWLYRVDPDHPTKEWLKDQPETPEWRLKVEAD